MPRGRFLSKSISLDEKVNALSDDTARLLFTWLISHLDCEGRLHGDATTVKSIVFPRRKISERRIDKYLNEISKLGLIFRYAINGNTYIMVPGFEKHQSGLQKSKEAQSQIPPHTPELLQSKSKQTPPQVQAKDKVKVEAKDIYAQKQNFDLFWEIYPKKKAKADAEKSFKKLNPDEKLLGIIISAVELAKKSSGWLEKNGQYVPLPSTYLNHRRWEDEITAGELNGTHKQSSRALPKVYRTPEEIFGDS